MPNNGLQFKSWSEKQTTSPLFRSWLNNGPFDEGNTFLWFNGFIWSFQFYYVKTYFGKRLVYLTQVCSYLPFGQSYFTKMYSYFQIRRISLKRICRNLKQSYLDVSTTTYDFKANTPRNWLIALVRQNTSLSYLFLCKYNYVVIFCHTFENS